MIEQYKTLKKYLDANSSLDETHYKLLCTIHAEWFNHKYIEPCTCSPKRIKGWIDDVNRYYEKNKN